MIIWKRKRQKKTREKEKERINTGNDVFFPIVFSRPRFFHFADIYMLYF